MPISLFIIALVEASIVIGVLFFVMHSKQSSREHIVGKLEAEVLTRKETIGELESLMRNTIEAAQLAEKTLTLTAIKEALKVERGRVTITQAELETVEDRLREFEEIERELEASGVEAKEELKILNKKAAELARKNDALKDQLSESNQALNELLKELEGNSQQQAHIEAIQTQILQTQEKVTTLLTEIEEATEQYFLLKQRYDALDIEYAQLYEKFSEAEAAAGRDVNH